METGSLHPDSLLHCQLRLTCYPTTAQNKVCVQTASEAFTFSKKLCTLMIEHIIIFNNNTENMGRGGRMVIVLAFHSGGQGSISGKVEMLGSCLSKSHAHWTNV